MKQVSAHMSKNFKLQIINVSFDFVEIGFMSFHMQATDIQIWRLIAGIRKFYLEGSIY